MIRFLICALVLLTPSAALAHVTLAIPAALGGSYYVGEFRVGHGCDDSPTVSVRIDVPGDVLVARPQPKPGWTVATTREKLARPITSEGRQVTERVASITWRGKLPADQFDEFAVMMKLPARGGALYFPVIQTCETGERRWTETPKPGVSSERPAALLNLAAPAGQSAPAHNH